jgi:hypothetical protein
MFETVFVVPLDFCQVVKLVSEAAASTPAKHAHHVVQVSLPVKG